MLERLSDGPCPFSSPSEALAACGSHDKASHATARHGLPLCLCLASPVELSLLVPPCPTVRPRYDRPAVPACLSRPAAPLPLPLSVYAERPQHSPSPTSASCCNVQRRPFTDDFHLRRLFSLGTSLATASAISLVLPNSRIPQYGAGIREKCGFSGVALPIHLLYRAVVPSRLGKINSLERAREHTPCPAKLKD